MAILCLMNRLSLEDNKALLGLCKSGRLYEVEEWIRSGRSILPPEDARNSPLDIAMELGFHSLVELLAKNTTDQEELDCALARAVDKQRIDLVELLIQYGADTNAIPFEDVLWNWNPGVIRLFLEKGADVLTGNPFARAFRYKRRTALGPYLETKREHPEWAKELQEQVDMALRYFCREGNMKWISLLMWAGANPHSFGPEFDQDPEDEEMYTSGTREACWRANFEVLKKLNPSPNTDDMDELLRCACSFGSRDVIRFLVDRGADPNTRDQDGRSALDRCVSHLDWDRYSFYGSTSKSDKIDSSRSRDTMESIEELITAGAKWGPHDSSAMNYVRRTFYSMNPRYVLDFVRLLLKHDAACEESLIELLRTKTMRNHVSAHWEAIVKAFPVLRPKPKKSARRKRV